MPYANVEDKKAHDRRYYLANRAKRIANSSAWQNKFHEKYRTRIRAWYAVRGRDLYYKKTYGISLEDYERMLIDQGGKCAICGSLDPRAKREHFAVDHCHTTGKVRGLLCIPCNTAIGQYEINKKAIDAYLGARND